MRTKILLGGLLASALVLPALAQSSPPAAGTHPAATTPPPAAMAPASTTNLWRASKLIGVNVYNDQNEKLGDIKELLLDNSGKIDGVVIGVGGFLGMGEHDIRVEMSKLKFVNEPVRTSSTTTTTTGTNTPRSATTTTTPTRSDEHKWYPDHAVLSGVTKDQLKSMTEFKF